jgi:hypothetical protein
MNIVYKITFTKRKANGIMPYLYIGSKSNCSFKDGIIYDSRNKPYYGSSTLKNYKEIVQSDICKTEILYMSDVYENVLYREREEQIKVNAVSSPEYFNRSLAMENTFHDPNYATYKHKETGKIVRLLRTDECVLNGEYAGVTFGKSLSDETKRKIVRTGEENGFYGKKHSEETKRIIGEKNKGNKRKPEDIEWFRENVAKAKRTAEWKAKIGRAELVTLKNINTGESIRISKQEAQTLNTEEWVNPYRYKAITFGLQTQTCEYCNRDIDIHNYKRWHGDKCKKRPLQTEQNKL